MPAAASSEIPPITLSNRLNNGPGLLEGALKLAKNLFLHEKTSTALFLRCYWLSS